MTIERTMGPLQAHMYGPLLDVSLASLRQQCESWSSALAFERDELAFLADLLRKKSSIATIDKVIEELVAMVADLQAREQDVVHVRSLLDKVLADGTLDDRPAREAFHHAAGPVIAAMEREAALKRRIMDLVRSERTGTGNAVLQAIQERRSVRCYRSDAVPADLIERIIDAGRAAPSALDRQPWHFHVTDDKALIRDMDKAISEKMHSLAPLPHAMERSGRTNMVFHGAPVVVFISAPEKDPWADVDVGACAQNMMLAAHALGLSTCPVGLGRLIAHTRFGPLLRLGSAEEVKLAIVIGIGAEHPAMPLRKRNNVFRIGTPAAWT